MPESKKEELYKPIKNKRKRRRKNEAQELELAYLTCGYISNADGVETRSRKRARLLEGYF